MTGIPKVGKEDSQADWSLWSIMSLRACWQSCIHACLVAQLCLTFCDPVDCHPPGSSVHGILQARIVEWVAISYTWGSSQPRDQSHVSCICSIDRQILYHWCHPGSPRKGQGRWQIPHSHWLVATLQSCLANAPDPLTLEGRGLICSLKAPPLWSSGHLDSSLEGSFNKVFPNIRWNEHQGK